MPRADSVRGAGWGPHPTASGSHGWFYGANSRVAHLAWRPRHLWRPCAEEGPVLAEKEKRNHRSCQAWRVAQEAAATDAHHLPLGTGLLPFQGGALKARELWSCCVPAG
jgi:hypothetical protein